MNVAVDNTYFIVCRYSNTKNTPIVIGFIPNITDVLTTLEAPFNCTAQIRVTLSKFLQTLIPGDEIQGKFGNTDRHMRIDSMHYNDITNTCTIYCVQTDMWVYSHRIAFEYEEYAKTAGIGLTPYYYWHETTFQQKLYILYGFSLFPNKVKVSSDTPPSDFPNGGETNRPPPILGKSLMAWEPTKIKTSFHMHLATIRDVMGSVVDLYKPAWNADTTIRFYQPWEINLSRDIEMIRFISHGLSSAPTIGYGRGANVWKTARLVSSPPYGMEYERIYDITDEYDGKTLEGLTKRCLDTDKSEGEWWEVELLDTGRQELWIGDTVVGDFLMEDGELMLTRHITHDQNPNDDDNMGKAVITRITYDQTPDRTRTYLHMGKAPATVTDRLNALRLEARRDLELTWMKGLPIDKSVNPSSIKNQ